MTQPPRRSGARKLAALLSFAALVASTPLLSGCPSNLCLLTVNGRCELSNCGSGEVFDDRSKRCVCEAGRIAVGSSCLTQSEAKRYCGRGAFWGQRGCQPIVCNQGYVLDEATEQCVPKAAVDQAAGVAPGQTLTCAQGTVLVVSAGSSACVPIEKTCARDEYFDGRMCAKLPPCPTGFELDPVTRQCVQVTQRPSSKDDRAVVDLATWARANYGPDGGPGSQALCGPLARKPGVFGVSPGGSMRVVIPLALSFPQGQTEGAAVMSQGLVEATGTPVTQKGALEIQAAAEEIISSLRAQRARAQPPDLRFTVRCTIVNSAPPMVVPASGGA